MKVRRIQQVFRECEFLDYRKEDVQHEMKVHHMTRRVAWVAGHVTYDTGKCGDVVFLTRKSLTWTGPIILNFYWNEISCEERIFYRQKKGGGDVMV